LNVYDRTPSGEIAARAKGTEIVLTNKSVLTRDAIMALEGLRYIGILATGYNVVDLAAARERGVVVTNVPSYGTPAVAQATFALLLELTNHAGAHAEGVRRGKWTASADFCYWDYPLVELSGRTMGIVGFGGIGREVAGIAAAFGMRVLVNTRRANASGKAEFVELDRVFRESDVVSLHCPLTDETRAMVNRERLAIMKPTAFLINTGRGALVDEAALAAALNERRIAGAALDVLAVEPPRADNPLLTAANCIITPHIAWATKAARSRLMGIAVANVKAFMEGTPMNVVS
jgi:glycerate dehydrogenase